MRLFFTSHTTDDDNVHFPGRSIYYRIHIPDTLVVVKDIDPATLVRVFEEEWAAAGREVLPYFSAEAVHYGIAMRRGQIK